jgi:hypothetical protein
MRTEREAKDKQSLEEAKLRAARAAARPVAPPPEYHDYSPSYPLYRPYGFGYGHHGGGSHGWIAPDPPYERGPHHVRAGNGHIGGAARGNDRRAAPGSSGNPTFDLR